MDKQVTVWIGAVLLLAALNFSQAEVISTYFQEGGKITLRPKTSGTITNILWKYNGNLLAEWVKNEVPLFYYDKYKGRTTLNTATGELEIQKMKLDDVGRYTVEINNKVHGQSYDVKWITKVLKPVVLFRPLTCGKESESCTVSCDGQEPGSLKDAEPIEYSWKMGENDWGTELMTKEIIVTSAQTEEMFIKTIACRMKNPVSQEDSEPKENLMYKEPPPPPFNLTGLIIGILIVVLIVLVVVIVLRKYRPDLFTRCRRGNDIENVISPEHHPLRPGDDPKNSPGDPPTNSNGAETNKPSEAETNKPSEAETNKPSEAETNKPSEAETNKPSEAPHNDLPKTEPINSTEAPRNDEPEGSSAL